MIILNYYNISLYYYFYYNIDHINAVLVSIRFINIQKNLTDPKLLNILLSGSQKQEVWSLKNKYINK